MLDELVLVLALAGIVTATEFVAAIERPLLKSRAQGVLFLVIGSIGGIALFDALQSLWGRLGIQSLYSIPLTGLAGMVLGVLFADFLAYWLHRFLHRFAWRIHAVHHSATDLCAASNYAHFAEAAFRFLLFILPLSLVSFTFEPIPQGLMALRAALEFYIHSPTRAHLGPLMWVFVDNRFHRIHHSVEEQHFDRNFGILFSFWDRLFGTVYEPGKEWPKTGIPGTPPPQGLVDYALFPVRRFRRTLPVSSGRQFEAFGRMRRWTR